MTCPINPLNTWCGDANSKYHTYEPIEIPCFGDHRELARLEHTTSQPHFIPGYTGYTPGSVEFMTGMTYGHYTNDLLTDHRVGGSRLSRIPGDFNVLLAQRSPQRCQDNPHKTLEPHFVPGYTGFTPGSGIRRSDGIGNTYGKMTHLKLAKHSMRGGRLRPIREYPKEYVAGEEDIKFYCYEHEITRDDVKRWKDQVPGYAGHIPRAIFRHGKNKTKITEESIAEFQKIMNK